MSETSRGHDRIGVVAKTTLSLLQVVLAYLACAGAGGLLAAFIEGAKTGVRAFSAFLVIGGFFLLLQLVRIQWWPLAIGIAFAIAGASRLVRKLRSRL